MRIVIDLQSCQSGSRLGGIGRYSMELAKALARAPRQHDLWLALNALMPDSVTEIKSAFDGLIPNERIQIFDLPPYLHIRTAEPARVRAAEIIREDFLQSLQPDFVHIMSMFEGFDEDVVTSVGQHFPGSKTSVTLHDLIPLVQSARYLPDGKSQDYYERKIRNIKNAQLLLANSEFSRREGIDLLDLPLDRVINVSAAADERFKPNVPEPQRAARLLARYGIQRKFLMYTASFDSRKNQANLISAFALLPHELRKSYQLVLMGGGEEAALVKLRALVKKLGLHEREVIFPGHVLDIDLVALYNLCHLFVLPSLAEGFGLPALEAMSCGTATIGSNLTSVPEVIGWSEALFDPTSPALVAKKIHQALTEPGFLQALRDHGASQAKKFSWKQTADRAFDAFEAQHARAGEGKVYGVDQSRIKNTNTAHKPAILFAPENVSGIVRKILDLDGAANLSNEDILEISTSIATNRATVDALFRDKYFAANDTVLLQSCLCTEQRIRSPAFQNWGAALRETPGRMHRKIWEFCFICEALHERGLLSPAMQGLGFAVGEEPLSSLFATRGVDIVATDLATDDARKIGWLDTNEHASELSILNKRNICDPAMFSERVKFQFCDMNHIPAEFNERFDFVWSACALEHLGSIKLGQEFVYHSIKCLKPGGIAVHTTEYNISSKTDTVDNAGTVIFRQCDIQEIIDTLRSQGHLIEMDWDEGNGPADKFIGAAPYCDDPHLKLKLWQCTTTSIGLIIKKHS